MKTSLLIYMEKKFSIEKYQTAHSKEDAKRLLDLKFSKENLENDDGQIREVKSADEFENVFTIGNIEVNGNVLNLVGEITTDNIQEKVILKGEIYKPINKFSQNTKGVTINIEGTNNFEFLSFTIEEKANEALLLPVNDSLKGKTVLKAAILEKNTDKIIYIEDEIAYLSIENIILERIDIEKLINDTNNSKEM